MKSDYTRGKNRERLLATIEFKKPDRMPVRDFCCSQDAIEVITGRKDFMSHPKEVYAESLKKWEIDLCTQFVLPHRLDRKVGPMVENDVLSLLGVLPKMFNSWKEKKGFSSPEDFRDFCQQLPESKEAYKYVDKDKVFQQWLALHKWGDFLDPTVWIPGHLAGTCRWMWYGYVGYENYLMSHILYPEALEKLFAFNAEEARLQNEAIAKCITTNNLFPLK